jgi:ADP-heptose:LPS heptosyltransferase
METTFKTSYIDGASVDIIGDDGFTYDVFFYDNSNDELIHREQLRCGYWTKTSRKYFTNWKIVILRNDVEVFLEELNLNNKVVKIILESNALGDNIGWVPYCEEFRKKHNCDLIVETKLYEFFKPYYDKITWKGLMDTNSNDEVYAFYSIVTGIDNFIHKEQMKKLNQNFIKGINIKYVPNLTFFDNNNHPEHPSLIPLQKNASNILGLEWKEIRPNFEKTLEERPIEKKYICISEFASSYGMKEWNNQIGWKTLIEELKKLGYEIVSISKEKSNLKNIIKRNGDYLLSDRIWYLKHCEFFIGLSSGLSWLSWSVNKKTVMIAGFTEDWYEFQENAIRVKNYNACTGCFNSEEHVDKLSCYHGSFCPENKNFECSRKISPKMVIEKLKENNLI